MPSLESLQSQDGWLAYLSAAHLMLFYLGGSFYSVAQRLTGVGYISTIPKRQGYEPPIYEVLGVLLGIQLSVKAVLEVRRWRRLRRQQRQEFADQQERDAEEFGQEKETNASNAGGVDPATTVIIDHSVFSHASQPAKRLPPSPRTILVPKQRSLLTSYTPTYLKTKMMTIAQAAKEQKSRTKSQSPNSTPQRPLPTLAVHFNVPCAWINVRLIREVQR